MRTILTILIGLLVIANAGSKKPDEYNKIYKQLKSLPSQQLTDKGDTYFERTILDSALICYTLVASRYNKDMPKSERELCIHSYLNSGTVHYTMYNYVQAQTLYLKALEISRECGDSLQLPRIYNNLGNIYAIYNDFKKAKDYYIEAYDGMKGMENKELKIKILNNLLGIYSNLRDGEKLQYYLNICQELQANDSTKSIFNYFTKGWISLLDHNPHKAVEYQKEALKLIDLLKLPQRYRCSALNNISEAFLEMQIPDSVEYYLKECAEIAAKEGLLDIQGNVYRQLSDIYSQKNNINKYFHYTKLYQQINDSINSVQSYRNISNMEFLFEVNRLNKYITGMQAEQMLKEVRLKNQQQILFIIGSAFLIATCLLVAVYLQKRKLQYSYREIFRRNAEIIESEKQSRNLYQKYHSEIQKKEGEIIRLQKEIGKLSYLPTNETETENETNTEEDIPAKYQGSLLTDEQKKNLFQLIDELMNTTMEYCNPDFTLEKVALLINSKPKYVSQVINETCNKNFNRYVNEFRIKEARLRLMDIEKYGNYTVKAIAQSVGFRSNSNFNTLFKELTGITPSMYQEMAKY